jgi:hypothetical protein
VDRLLGVVTGVGGAEGVGKSDGGGQQMQLIGAGPLRVKQRAGLHRLGGLMFHEETGFIFLKVAAQLENVERSAGQFALEADGLLQAPTEQVETVRRCVGRLGDHASVDVSHQREFPRHISRCYRR